MDPQSFLAPVLAAAVSQLGGLIGGLLLIWREHIAHRLATLSLSFAAGTLLGVTFFDLLPETVEKASSVEQVFLYVLLGMLLFFVIEKLLLWHHHVTTDDETIALAGDATAHINAPLVRGKRIRPLVMFGDGLHNFLDGITIAITFTVSPALGLTTALAVMFHEWPHNISDFAMLLHTGMRRKSVLVWNLVLAMMSPLAALIASLALNKLEQFHTPLLAIAAGNFLYIATVNLIPEIHHEERPKRILAQIALLLLGVGLMWLIGQLFPHGHDV